MKIIEGMKGIKANLIKAEDLRKKIAANSAILNIETPAYEDTAVQVQSWLDTHREIIANVESLRLAIQRTNIATDVTLTIGGKSVTKSIAAWVHRRRDLATFEKTAWAGLTDRNLREQNVAQSTGQVLEVRIKRFYNPKLRDEKTGIFTQEPHEIDAQLEVVNATTDLILDTPAKAAV